MWMLYCKKLTFARQADTNDQKYSIMSNFGQVAMPMAMNLMERELPLLIYAQQMAANVKSAGVSNTSSCSTFYVNNFGMNN